VCSTYCNDTEVAVKIETVDSSDFVGNSLAQEFSILERLAGNPNVVQAFGLAEAGSATMTIAADLLETQEKKVLNSSMMMLEHCSNGDLFDLVSKSKGISDLPLLKHLFRQICSPISSMHNELGMGHFDIKLENILLGNYFKPKLCDMGLAKPLNETQFTKAGTVSYFAPEIHSAEKIGFGGSKCDIFALGVLLFTMYVGMPPWMQTTTQD
jgi:serine/threonine protein kinase